MSRDRIRPLPSGATLADRIRAIGSNECEPGTGRALGARSTAELHAWCEELATIASEYETACELGDTDAEIAGDPVALAARIAELDRLLDETCAVRDQATAMLVQWEPKLAPFDDLVAALQHSPGGAREYKTVGEIVEQVRTLARVSFSALFPEHPELDKIGEEIAAREAQLVDLLELELEVVRAYRLAGALDPDAPPPSTAELLARMRGGS